MSAYIQLHSPFEISSANDNYAYQNLGNNLKPDPQLDENLVIAEIMSTLQSHYPLQEVSVFFNGSEYSRQKHFATQNTLNFGLSMIKHGDNFYVNRSYDDSHLKKSWYLDAINRFKFANGKIVNNEAFLNEEEKLFFLQNGPFDSAITNSIFRFDHFTISMNLRSNIDGSRGSFDVPVKSYDAPTSGVWFGPYYDCMKGYAHEKNTLKMSYNVPIITSMNKQPM